MGVPEYQQILFEDDNLIVPLGPMVQRNVSKLGEYHALKYITFVTCVLCLLHLYIWNQNGLPFISRKYNTRCKWVSETCDKLQFPHGSFSSYHVIKMEPCHQSLLKKNGKKMRGAELFEQHPAISLAWVTVTVEICKPQTSQVFLVY